jgi:hypothetical protein
MWMIRRANTEKYGSVMNDMSYILSQFSNGSNVVKMHAKHSEHVKPWMHAIIAVTVIASSGLSLISSELALETAIGVKMAMDAGKPVAGAASYVQGIMTSSDYAQLSSIS